MIGGIYIKQKGIEVLVSTMNQVDFSLIDKMNIKGNALIINQCQVNQYYEIADEKRTVKFYSFNERGVGLSRNNALMRASSDICLFADDDVVYHDQYERLIIEAFLKKPQADVIIFNVPSSNEKRSGPAQILKNSPVHYLNFMRYGTYSIAFRREKILKANIYFSLLFGGGAKYSAGEDTLFLFDCLNKGLKIWTNTAEIGIVHHNQSTWFKGFNQKYFFDKGFFYATMSKKFSSILILQFAIRKYKIFKNEMGFLQAIKYMLAGRKHCLIEGV